ncbi:MAG: beta-ketoacyl-[acyl-carrier-protein] synthase family protein [Pseudomonadota bacterium]
MSRRVVVTGLGAVCGAGENVDEFWANVSNGNCAIRDGTRTCAGTDLSVTLPIAEIENADALVSSLGRSLSRADLYTQYAALAGDEAIKDAGLDPQSEAFDPTRTAAIIGTGIGGQLALEQAYTGMLRKGRRPHPLTILKTIPNAAASQLSIRFGFRGPAFAISSACASAAHAIGVAGDIIRSGGADIAIAGASEAVLTYGSLEAWKAMHILSDEKCRPFSKNRRGLVIGEGAGLLILEAHDHASKRGAKIYGELLGFGMNADGVDMINPAVEGASGAMEQALSALTVSDWGRVYVNAHGTGTLMNDPTETKAIRIAVGQDADALCVSSTKSVHGHLLGAAGGVEAIASLKALNTGTIPPTVNYDEPDPECDLDITPNEARERTLDYVVSNSFAFGGLNAVLAFGRV